MNRAFAAAALFFASACNAGAALTDENCTVAFMILGAGQDAGAPQIGYHQDSGWKNEGTQLRATSAALIDRHKNRRYLFEATPDISKQLYDLEEAFGSAGGPLGLDGIFLTHAHIGHYAGLMLLGREAANTNKLPVYAMDRMAAYLETNGPWEQLVTLSNITIRRLQNEQAVALGSNISVTPLQVPHRDEYSETVGFIIQGPARSLLFLPDIDDWAPWEEKYGQRAFEILQRLDYAFVDATFYSDNELPNRDMSRIPHPRVTETMDRFESFSEEKRRGIHFIHYNHTNPIRFMGSPESKEVHRRGYSIARRGDRFCL